VVNEPCLYVKNDKNNNILSIVGTYIDDIYYCRKRNILRKNIK